MFQNFAVTKIVETATVFGKQFGYELDRANVPLELRGQLHDIFERALINSANELNTSTAHDAVKRILPKVKNWLGC